MFSIKHRNSLFSDNCFESFGVRRLSWQLNVSTRELINPYHVPSPKTQTAATPVFTGTAAADLFSPPERHHWLHYIKVASQYPAGLLPVKQD